MAVANAASPTVARSLLVGSALLLPLIGWCAGGTSNAAAALAGGGAAAALGAGSSNQTSSNSSLGGGGGNAPIEVEIMAYHGLQVIARDIARVTSQSTLCKDVERCAVLLEDATSATQIALYQSVESYHRQMQGLHETLRRALWLQVLQSAVAFDAGHSTATVDLLNNGSTALEHVKIEARGADAAAFHLDDPTACHLIPANMQCRATIRFEAPDHDSAHGTAYHAVLSVSADGIDTAKVPVTATRPSRSAGRSTVRPGTPFESVAPSYLEGLASADVASGTPATSTGVGTAGAGGAGSGGGSAATPLSIQWMGGIGTALGLLKSGISYSSSSFQPSSQSFQVLLEKELLVTEKVDVYTSTSPLDLSEATQVLATLFQDMLLFGTDITVWTNQCKPASATTPGASPPAAPGAPGTSTPPTHTVPTNNRCADSAVITDLAVGQQMLSAYSTLLQTPNDGNGNMVLVDILRGEVLQKKLASGMNSLQTNVVAAAGSMRSNTIFFLDIFYVPKPDYNSGVIATFELRNGHNDLVDAGARTAFYDYNKRWKGSKYPSKAVQAAAKAADGSCTSSFCAEDN